MCTNVIIANQRARWGRSRRKIHRAQHILRKMGYPFSLVTTDHPEHARELARAACAQSADTIVVLGGDGTVNEVINGILTSEYQRLPKLGIIPAGSSNDFARSLGIPQTLCQACQTIIQGKTKHIDIGQAGPHYFCMASCIALLADIAATSMEMRGLLGSMRYIVAALKVIRTMSTGWHIKIKADDHDLDKVCAALLVSNTARFGGLTLMPQAQPDDGVLDCLLVEMVSKREALGLVPLALRQGLERHPKVTHFQARSLSLSLEPHTHLCNDGEVYAQTFQDIQYRILPRKLPVIC
jgi:diacylglycerol kinase (ATP)